jgi:CrcB protein
MSLGIASVWEGNFPLGTFIINVLGCFCIGFLGGLSERTTIDPNLRLLLQTGFLGGFTTFSSFGLETFQLLHRGEGGTAAAYLTASNLVGVGVVIGAFFLSKWLFAPRG